MTQSDKATNNNGEPTVSGPQQGRLIHHSRDLLQGRPEAWIEHNGEMYRLRITSRGKLYLTK